MSPLYLPPKLGQTRHTQHKPLHNVASNPQPGVARYEMVCNLPRLPRPAADPAGGALAHATASAKAKAKAVPQHGGGLVQANRPRSQPVKGYALFPLAEGSPINTPNKKSIADMMSLCMLSTSLKQAFHKPLVARDALIPVTRIKAFCAAKSENQPRKYNPKLLEDRYALNVQVVIETSVDSLEHEIEHNHYSLIRFFDASAPLIQNHITYDLLQLQSKKSQTLRKGTFLLLAFSSSSSSGYSMLMIRDHESRNDRTNSSYRLRPSWSTFCTPRNVETASDQKNGQRRNQQKPGPETYRDFIGQHTYLLSNPIPASLPAPCHHVQRGDA